MGEDWGWLWGPESEAELGLALLGGPSALNSELGEEEHSGEVRMPAHHISPGCLGVGGVASQPSSLSGVAVRVRVRATLHRAKSGL